MKLIEIKDTKEALFLAFSETNLDEVKQEIKSFMNGNQYKIKEENQRDGTNLIFEKGNRTMRILFGAFVTYHKQSFQILDKSDRILVAFRKSSSGMSGGVIGVQAVKKEFKKLKTQLENKFQLNAIGVE